MVRHISLSNGGFATVDEEDFARLSCFTWWRHDNEHTSYATAAISGEDGTLHKTVGMHRFLMGCKRGDGTMVDHWDRNGLNNVKSNLRLVNQTQSACNRGKKQWKGRSSSSRYKGVCWSKEEGKFRVRICINGKRRLVGDFVNEEQAAREYDAAATEVHGEFAVLNFPR
jgi:hypothetical protein